MADDLRNPAVTEFYETHPINEQQILDKLTSGDEINVANLTEDTLQQYDQDHYGGVEANDALAKLAAIDSECHVLDVCCGLGGPSRYLAHNYGCQVTGIDFTNSRVIGAKNLTHMVKLDHLVEFQNANALDLPFEDKTFDIVMSQEAFCHIPNKDQLIAECVRVLKPGGKIVFTDILVSDATSDATKEKLQQGMAFLELGSRSSYRRQLEQEGCEILADQDISKEWQTILTERLAMYRSLKDQTVASFGSDHFEKWDNAYSFFVGLYATGELGGGRFLAKRKVDDA